MEDYGSCCLGSINLGEMITRIDVKTTVSYERLRETVHLAIRFLDNVIDVNTYPVKEVHDMAHSTRRIGLGIMGWADMLVELGIPYNSSEALTLAREVGSFIRKEALLASTYLAKEKGYYPSWDGFPLAKIRICPSKKLQRDNCCTYGYNFPYSRLLIRH